MASTLFGTLNTAALFRLNELQNEVIPAAEATVDGEGSRDAASSSDRHDRKHRRLFSPRMDIPHNDSRIGDSKCMDKHSELEKVRLELARAKAEIESLHTLSSKLREENEALRDEVKSCRRKEFANTRRVKELENQVLEIKAESANASTERDLLRDDNLRLANERDELQKTLESVRSVGKKKGAQARGAEPLTLKGFLERRSQSNYMVKMKSSSSLLSGNSGLTPETCLWEDDEEDCCTSDEEESVATHNTTPDRRLVSGGNPTAFPTVQEENYRTRTVRGTSSRW